MSDENRSMDRKVVFEPYDMDTALGTNNSGVLMFSPYLEDTDTVSSVIAGGDSGGSEAPVYNAQDSVLWNNIRDAFRSELVQMYRTLRASNGPWQYNAIEKRFEDHQAKWPEAIFNEDAWVKYIIPLVDPVTVDEDTGELIRTDRYLTMLQGSKKEQRKWWLYNRLRYLDSKYDTGNASANIINIRFFNGGVLKLKTAIPLYAAVSFGGGTTPEIKRTEANTEVSFTYTPGTGVTEMETWIHSGNLITDVGDLSVFYPNECDFSKASLLRRLKIGSNASGYSNANLTTLNVQNSPLLESIDCRNCPRLGITLNLENSPRLAEAYFEGTAITGLDLADGCAIETLHLPATITALTLLNLTKLSELVVTSYANVARLMMSNIDSTVVDPVTVLESIHSNAQVNIQGLYLELQDAEAIGDFFDLLDTFTGVTRERSSTTGEWIYHSEEKAVVSGEVHTAALTGEEMAVLNARYPYVRTTADHISTTLKYYNYDGSELLYTETILDGGDGTYAGTPARADSADWRYTFIGWNTQQDQYVADPNAKIAVTTNRNLYAAYSRTSIANLKYYTYDGSTLLYTETIIGGGNGTWNGAPTRAADARYTYTFAGWTSVPNGQVEANIRNNVTTHKSIYAAYTAEGQKYSVRFFNGSGNIIQTVNNVLYGGTATFTGTVPAKTGVEDPEMYEFIGWNPSNTNIQGNTDCYPTYKYNGIKFRKIIDKTFTGPYSNSLVTTIRSYAFYSCSQLTEISFPNASDVGSYAFAQCGALRNIDLPNTTVLYGSAFYSCPNIRNVNLPKVIEIGASCFYSCMPYGFSSLGSVNMPNLEVIGENAFTQCRIVDLPALSNKVRIIRYAAFGYASLRGNIRLGVIERIDSSAFANTAISSIDIPYLSGALGSNMFGSCYNLISASLPNITEIGSSCFQRCSALPSINLPEVSRLYNSAFWQCYSISFISIPKVSSIYGGAFGFCSSLSTIILGTDISVVCNLMASAANVFSSTTSYSEKIKIYVPDSLVTAYQSATYWSNVSGMIKGISEFEGV